MSQRCSICSNPGVDAINVALAAGQSARAIARDTGLGHDSINRHRTHLERSTSSLVSAPTGTDPLSELVTALRSPALDGQNSSMSREYRLALMELVKKSSERPAYNVLNDPEWLRLRGVLLDALRPYPDARQAVADALGEL